MIRKVSFRNFKAYRSLDLELEPFTVLVGPNASGKTTLLEGLELLCQTAGRDLLGTRNHAAESSSQNPLKVQSYGSSAFPELSIWGNWSGTPGSLHVSTHTVELIEPADPEAFGMKPGESARRTQEFSVSGEWGSREFPSEVERELPGVFDEVIEPHEPPLENFGVALSSTTVLRFDSRRMADASYSDEVVPTIKSDGGDLASVLAHLKLSWDDVFSEIELALKQIVPSVQRIRLERAEVEQTAMRTISLDEQRHRVPEKRTLWGHRVVLDMKGAKSVPADAAGEGTLMALGLLTILIGPNRPKLVLLDDIEMALHPAAQGQLIRVLRKIQERDPELQIVATSHSPFVLNFLKPEEVRITSLADNGLARCVPMTSHPDFERWKDMMSPGEFWSTVGESWVHKSEDASGQGEPAAHE